MHWCIPQENEIAQDSPSNFANQHLLHQILGYFLTIGFTEQPHWRKLTPWNLPISFIDTSNSKKTMNPQNLYVSEPNEKETLRNIFIPTMVLWPQTLKKKCQKHDSTRKRSPLTGVCKVDKVFTPCKCWHFANVATFGSCWNPSWTQTLKLMLILVRMGMYLGDVPRLHRISYKTPGKTRIVIFARKKWDFQQGRVTTACWEWSIASSGGVFCLEDGGQLRDPCRLCSKLGYQRKTQNWSKVYSSVLTSSGV